MCKHLRLGSLVSRSCFFHTILVHVGPTIGPKILGSINRQVLIACVSDLNEMSCKLMWLRNMGQQLPAPEALHPRCYC